MPGLRTPSRRLGSTTGRCSCTRAQASRTAPWTSWSRWALAAGGAGGQTGSNRLKRCRAHVSVLTCQSAVTQLREEAGSSQHSSPAINHNHQRDVPLTEELAEALTPPRDAGGAGFDSGERQAVLLRIARVRAGPWRPGFGAGGFAAAAKGRCSGRQRFSAPGAAARLPVRPAGASAVPQPLARRTVQRHHDDQQRCAPAAPPGRQAPGALPAGHQKVHPGAPSPGDAGSRVCPPSRAGGEGGVSHRRLRGPLPACTV